VRFEADGFTAARMWDNRICRLSDCPFGIRACNQVTIVSVASAELGSKLIRRSVQNVEQLARPHRSPLAPVLSRQIGASKGVSGGLREELRGSGTKVQA